MQTKALKVPGLSHRLSIAPGGPGKKIMNQSMEIVKNNRNISSDLRDETHLKSHNQSKMYESKLFTKKFTDQSFLNITNRDVSTELPFDSRQALNRNESIILKKDNSE